MSVSPMEPPSQLAERQPAEAEAESCGAGGSTEPRQNFQSQLKTQAVFLCLDTF